MSTKKLTLEINSGKPLAEPILAGGAVLVTPPIGEDWWLFRVQLSKDQAILGFPKFGTIGIGFSKEEDWNTNLPYQESTEGIFDHIKHNKGDDSISDDDCRRAIAMVQESAKLYAK